MTTSAGRSSGSPAVRAALISPVTFGAITLRNRVVMAPMTRMRATDAGVPTPLMAEYYRQRASAGLIITEGTYFSSESRGYTGSPGIETGEQVTAWRRVVDVVHDAGGRIALQLLHVGRVSHPRLLDGRQPLSASALPFADWVTVRAPDGGLGRLDCEVPAAMSTEDIARTVDDIAGATRRARDAGFDLIELHAAHGYLLHQFLSVSGNLRQDRYGGCIANRCRFALEAFDAAAAEWDAARVGLRVSPVGTFCGLDDPDGPDTARHLAAELDRRRAAYLHVSEPDWVGGPPFPEALRAELRALFTGPIVWAGGFDTQKAVHLRQAGIADAVAFGRPFLANPDLPERLATGQPLTAADSATFYGGEAAGYTDYPSATPSRQSN